MTNPTPIASIRNPWIRTLRQLQVVKGRRSQQCFLVEGTHLLQEAIATQWPLSAVCHTPEWVDRHANLVRQIPTAVRQQTVSADVLRSLSTTQTPDGVVAIARHRSSTRPTKSLSLAIGLETLQDPGNLGTLVRTAAAVAADGIWLSGDSVDPEHPKVLRASAGQWFRQPPTVVSLPDWLQSCRHSSLQVLAAAADGIPFWQYDLTQPTIFLLGNEGAGLSEKLCNLADGIVSIPMAIGVESLNVSTTGALLLYEAVRQREIS
jgi:TrmH family RNA methyltransferase